MLNAPAMLLRPCCGMLGSPVKPSRASSSPLLSSPAWLERLLRLRGRPLPRACGATCTGCRGGGRLQTHMSQQCCPFRPSRANGIGLTASRQCTQHSMGRVIAPVSMPGALAGHLPQKWIKCTCLDEDSALHAVSGHHSMLVQDAWQGAISLTQHLGRLPGQPHQPD